MLLDFSLAQFGQGLPLRREPTCLHDVGSRVLNELQALHPERELVCESSGDTCGEWDPNRLTQVVDNLLGNALRYSTADSPVRAVYRGERDTVVFQTHNLGPPIPEELRPHLFEPFRRGEHAAKKEGLGLGLYIVREVVEAHGGTIQVESSAEAGTTFTVHLPRKPPA
jgi:signal transduction histidine kinase